MMRALPLAAAAAAALLLAGCAQAADDATPTPEPAPPAQTTQAPTPAAIPTPTPTPTQDPQADWQTIETPNGTASFRIPPGWTAEVDGEEMLDYDGDTVWSNSVLVQDPSGGVRLSYWDGSGDDPGPVLDFGVLREQRIPALDADELEGVDSDPRYLEHWVRAWWDGGSEGPVAGHVAVTPGSTAGEQPVAGFSDGRRLIFFGMREEFDTVDEAVAWLDGDEVAAAFEVLATLDLHGAPHDALPAD